MSALRRITIEPVRVTIITMAWIEREIVINRPREAVFDFLVDGRNDPLWNREDLHMERAPERPIEVGTTFQGQVILLGRRELAYEITQYDRPNSFSFTVTRPPIPLDLHGTARFRPSDGGTTMSWSVELRGRGLLTPLTPVLTRIFTRRLADSFPAIRDALESRAE